MPGNMRFSLVAFLAFLCLPAGCRYGGRDGAVDTSSERPGESVEAVEQYWPNGELRLRKEVLEQADGTLVNHGTYAQWFNNGQKQYEAVFVHGKKNGTATRWHKNGRKWMEEQYVDGRRHGITRMWDTNGVQRQEERHFEGKPHGTWTKWDEHGNVKWQGTFEHGAPGP